MGTLLLIIILLGSSLYLNLTGRKKDSKGAVIVSLIFFIIAVILFALFLRAFGRPY